MYFGVARNSKFLYFSILLFSFLQGNVQKLLGNTGSTEDTLLPADTPQRTPHHSESPYASERQRQGDQQEQNMKPTREGLAALNRSLSLPEDMAEMVRKNSINKYFELFFRTYRKSLITFFRNIALL